METHLTERFRPLLEDDPPAFIDRVDTPWDEIPDLPSYNDAAYRRIVRDLERLRKQNEAGQKDAGRAAGSRGVLILGEAGTGKTHLLMRVARKLSERNHILFVRKPNNEEAVAQHVWANVVHSLSRNLPGSGHERSQLDDLLAHVFSDVLIPEFERDIEGDVNAEQRQRWVRLLKEDPYNLFLMLGEGEQRSRQSPEDSPTHPPLSAGPSPGRRPEDRPRADHVLFCLEPGAEATAAHVALRTGSRRRRRPAAGRHAALDRD